MNTFRASDAAPFFFAFSSLSVEQINAYGALALTIAGCVQVCVKAWLAYKSRKKGSR